MITRIAILTATALSLGTAAIAQTAAPVPSGPLTYERAPGPLKTLATIEPAEGVSNETLTDAKLRAFVQALAAIRVVGQHFVPRIEAETDGAKRAELMDYANDSIVNAIEVIADITPAEYKAIDMASQNDPVLNQRIQDEIVKAAEEGRAAAEAAAKAAEETGQTGETPKTE